MTRFLNFINESERKEYSVQICAGPGTIVEDAETYTKAKVIMDEYKTQSFDIRQNNGEYKEMPVDYIAIWPRYGEFSRAYENIEDEDDERFPEDPISSWSK